MTGINIYIIGFEEKSDETDKAITDLLLKSGYEKEAITAVVNIKSSAPHIMICSDDLSEAGPIGADIESSLSVRVGHIKTMFF